MSDEVIYNAKGLINDLKAIEPGLLKKMKAEAKKVSVPTQSLIQSAIPDVAPLSGMNQITKSGGSNNGRVAWGAGKPAKEVKFSIKTTGSKKFAVTSLFRLIVASPMTAIADTAGKGSGIPRNAITKPYTYKGGTRTHRVNGQGQNMIRVLGQRRSNKFVYPAVERSLPSVRAELKLVVEKYALMVNRKINK
jgi:hypothetical protein